MNKVNPNISINSHYFYKKIKLNLNIHVKFIYKGEVVYRDKHWGYVIGRYRPFTAHSGFFLDADSWST